MPIIVAFMVNYGEKMHFYCHIYFYVIMSKAKPRAFYFAGYV